MEYSDNGVAKYRLPEASVGPWLEALRSGEYDQGKGALNGVGGLCCLGVFCVVNGIKQNQLGFAGLISAIGLPSLFTPGENTPDWVPDELIGDTQSNYLVHELTYLNDAAGRSFEEIATWIDENVEKY